MEISVANTAGDNIFVSGILVKASAEIRRQEIGKGKMMALDLKVLMQRKARLESEIARAKKKESEARRREDSRRKIVLGGVVIAAIRDGGIPESLIRRLVQTHASDRDKAVLDGFAFEVAGMEPAASESYEADQPSGE